MDTTQVAQVDVVKIIEEIRREIEKKGFYDDLPTLDQVPVLEYTATNRQELGSLREQLANATKLCTIPADYPVEGNILKKGFKKVSQKATRCSIVPMSICVTRSNQELLQCLEQAMNVIERQQWQISDLDSKVEKLYEAMNQGDMAR